MIVDTSALVAILRNEQAAAALEDVLAGADALAMSAANYLETAMVVDAQAYALAKDRDEPLLYIGGDFSRTDVRGGL